MTEDVTRRTVIGGMLAAAAVVSVAEGKEEPGAQLQQHVDALVELFGKMYGGKWEARFRPDLGYVSFSRSLS